MPSLSLMYGVGKQLGAVNTLVVSVVGVDTSIGSAISRESRFGIVLVELVSGQRCLLTFVGVDTSIGSATSGNSWLGVLLLVDLVSGQRRFV